MTPVTNELCDARMETLNEKISQIQEDVTEIKVDVRAALDLAGKVNNHEKFISALKKYGLYVLLALSIAALSGGAVSIRELFKP
jgi:hypothetical protein